ncbi:MAG TPA: hypothetical protein PKN69_00725 [Candidatus Latescibacteria bacterium]|nr:hypothetical protein [Candidatus Latescibacterota bacterium]HOF60184.1 hypothetical protein [Candidatus Latescibacterota bacterium]
MIPVEDPDRLGRFGDGRGVNSIGEDETADCPQPGYMRPANHHYLPIRQHLERTRDAAARQR